MNKSELVKRVLLCAKKMEWEELDWPCAINNTVAYNITPGLTASCNHKIKKGKAGVVYTTILAMVLTAYKQ